MRLRTFLGASALLLSSLCAANAVELRTTANGMAWGVGSPLADTPYDTRYVGYGQGCSPSDLAAARSGAYLPNCAAGATDSLDAPASGYNGIIGNGNGH